MVFETLWQRILLHQEEKFYQTRRGTRSNGSTIVGCTDMQNLWKNFQGKFTYASDLEWTDLLMLKKYADCCIERPITESALAILYCPVRYINKKAFALTYSHGRIKLQKSLDIFPWTNNNVNINYVFSSHTECCCLLER